MAAGAPLLFSAVEAILSGVQVILAVVLIVLILMHSGKDSGLSGAFGVGTGAGPFGGGSLVERNLNRWTIGVRAAVRGERDRPAQDLSRTRPAEAVKRTSLARSGGQATPFANRRP